ALRALDVSKWLEGQARRRPQAGAARVVAHVHLVPNESCGQVDPPPCVAAGLPSNRSRPATRAWIFASAIDLASIQNPQSGLTYAIRSAPPSRSAALWMRPATSLGVSTTVVLMSITPMPNLSLGLTSRRISRSP